jgi:hypothetical protein
LAAKEIGLNIASGMSQAAALVLEVFQTQIRTGGGRVTRKCLRVPSPSLRRRTASRRPPRPFNAASKQRTMRRSKSSGEPSGTGQCGLRRVQRGSQAKAVPKGLGHAPKKICPPHPSHDQAEPSRDQKRPGALCRASLGIYKRTSSDILYFTARPWIPMVASAEPATRSPLRMRALAWVGSVTPGCLYR